LFLAITAASVCGAGGSPAHAQTETEEETDIVVTGTRIPRPDLSSASPVASFDADEIAAHGAAQLEDFLNTLPQASPDLSRTGNNPGDGVARVNLRHLGADRTLTLLNGRRLAPSGVTGASDLNSLPTALIQRIEVVTGGTSAVYGSDAVAGVVNFITRRDFEGAELTTQFDTYDAGDGDVFNASAVWGAYAFNERAHLMLYLDYLERDPVMQGDREFTAQSISDDPETGELFVGGSPTGPNGLINNAVVGGAIVPGRLFLADGSLRVFDFLTDFYNFAPDNYLQVPLERWSGGALARFEISPDLEASLELMFSAPRSARQLAPAPFSFVINVPIAANFFPPSTQAHLDAFFDPDNDGIARFRFSRRLSDLGPRQSIFERDNYRAVAALHGALGEWDWDGAYTYARNDTLAEFNNDASVSRIRQGMLINPATNTCLNPSGGCVPVNLFGPNTLSAAAADFIRIDDITEETSVEQQTFTAFVSGDLFELPAGALSASIGGEWRRLSTVYEPSAALATGDSAGFTQSPAVAGAFEVREAFGEVLVPLLAGAPFAHRLEFEGGARFAEHSVAGQHWSWKYGLQWRPIESVRVRAMAQRAVRAPNVLELYEAPRMNFNFTDSFGDFCAAPNDPVARGYADVCVAQGMDAGQLGIYDPAGGYFFDTISSGNTDLTPEIADTLTLGADWEFGDPWRVRVSADYFEIELRDAILYAAPFFNCGVAADPTDVACQLIQREPSGFVTLVENHPINYSRAIVEGVDLGLSADFSAPPWLAVVPDASIGVELLATHYLQVALAGSASAPLFDCVGYFGCGSYELMGSVTPEFVATTTLRYTAGPASLMLRWRYIGPLDNSAAALAAFTGAALPIMAIPEIDAANYVDLSFAYDINERARLSAGVDNVFEADPPQMANAQVQANTDPARYDVFGRRFFVRLSYRFD
jgi:outer membrane receptor protein involved in Fe transport